MANTIVLYHSLPSLGALTLKLYPRAGGAIENGAGDTLTESGSTPGLYSATVTEALSGIHAARVYSGSDLIGSYLIDMRDDVGPYDLSEPGVSPPEFWNRIADHVRRRQQDNVESSADGDTLDLSSEYGMIQMSQNANTTAEAGKITVLKTDGTSLGTLDTTSALNIEVLTGVG
jgi:hypothetical protein